MVRHQHIGVDLAAVLACRREQPGQIVFAVGIEKEDRLPIVAALDHVQRLVGQKVAAQRAMSGTPSWERVHHASGKRKNPL